MVAGPLSFLVLLLVIIVVPLGVVAVGLFCVFLWLSERISNSGDSPQRKSVNGTLADRYGTRVVNTESPERADADASPPATLSIETEGHTLLSAARWAVLTLFVAVVVLAFYLVFRLLTSFTMSTGGGGL